MKIGLRGGHSPNCKGAMGILDEQAEVRKIYNALVPMLQVAGHTVVGCNSDANNVNAELSEGTNKANSNNCDIYVTIHMNASGGAGHGTEVWMYNNANGTMNSIASRICQNFATKGFQNRGVKYSTGLHDLNAAAMPSMIIETLFCDNQHDADLYRGIGVNGIAKLIAGTITGENVSNIVVTKPTQSKPNPTPVKKPAKATNTPQIIYGVKTLHHGILSDVTGREDFAGYANDAIVGIKIGVTSGSVKYRVHCGGRWLPAVTGASWNDAVNGYAGDDKTSIDAIQIYYNTDINKAGRYYSAVYQVKPFNQSFYLPEVIDTNWESVDGDNTAGMFGAPFTQLLISLE